MSGVLRVAEQLLLIERELRAAQLWSQDSPSAEALASQQPFCVDSMPFEHWLQWVLLPRMKVLIETGAELPKVSGIEPMAQMAFAGREVELRGVFAELAAFDSLFEAS